MLMLHCKKRLVTLTKKKKVKTTATEVTIFFLLQVIIYMFN